MEKGFWDFNLKDPGTLWFWLLSFISIPWWFIRLF